MSNRLIPTKCFCFLPLRTMIMVYTVIKFIMCSVEIYLSIDEKEWLLLAWAVGLAAAEVIGFTGALLRKPMVIFGFAICCGMDTVVLVVQSIYLFTKENVGMGLLFLLVFSPLQIYVGLCAFGLGRQLA